MKSIFNPFGWFAKKAGAEIDLRDELAARQQRILQLQQSRHDDAGAHEHFSGSLCLRIDAAVAAKIQAMLKSGRTVLHLPEGQSVDEAVLGRQATQFRIYKRNLEKDLALALV